MDEFKDILEKLLIELNKEYRQRGEILREPWSDPESHSIEDYQTIKHMLLSTEEFLKLLKRSSNE